MGWLASDRRQASLGLSLLDQRAPHPQTLHFCDHKVTQKQCKNSLEKLLGHGAPHLHALHVGDVSGSCEV